MSGNAVVLLVGLLAVLLVVDATYIKSNKKLPRVARNYHAPGYDFDALPKNWDWRNVDGRSLVTVDRNQHIPQYCGSCWAHGTTSAIADRYWIKANATGTQPVLSVQAIVECASGALGCNGGNAEAVYEYAQKNGGIPHDTCNEYRAADRKCDKLSRCYTCWPGKGCEPVANYTSYTLKEGSSIDSDPKQLKAELYHHGPIPCGIAADPIVDYKGGIVNYTGGSAHIDHLVELVGYGEDEAGVQFWILRNSWGTAWGEQGWFRVISTANPGVTAENTLYVEEDCSIPIID
ncbi:Peptidase C1A domain containing protein [Aphelenchoides fujianensis]|nr:Peptidase C1A domain containing protein [Aphelenchoides fujianensis]